MVAFPTTLAQTAKSTFNNPGGILALTVVAIVAILGTLLVLSQRDLAATQRDQAAALENVTDVLNRRSPTLEYLNCHDKRQDKALDDAFALLLAGRDVTAAQEKALTDALTESREALLQVGAATADNPCPELPK